MRTEKPSVKLEDWAVVESTNTASYQPLGPGNVLVGRAFGHQRIKTGMFIFTSAIVDVDAHVVEPPDVWTSRLPAKYREVGPRVVYAPAGDIKLVGSSYIEAPGTEGSDVAWWFYEDRQTSLKRYIAAAGVPADEVTLTGVTYEDMRPGCFRAPERIADMTINGVQAQMCFPNYPRFCGQLFLWGKDKELARLCVEAYNDWMVEEWCGGSDGRLIPLCIVPLWDVQLAAAEVRRNAARTRASNSRGLKGLVT